MTITYTATLNPGAVSVANANWSDAAGFDHATAAKLLIRAGDENQTISGDLDQSSSTAAIDLLHAIGGSPMIVGTNNTPLIWTPDATYTTEPNFLWRCDGGVLYMEVVTNACVLSVFAGRGRCNLQDGEFQRIVVAGPTVNVAGACDISTEAVVLSGSLNLEASADTLPTLRMGGGSVWCRRRIETAAHLNAGTLRLYNTTGSALATLNINGGLFIPELGDVSTINRNGGLIDIAAARGPVALGGTAITNYGPDQFPKSSGLVTVGGGTTVDYAAYTGDAVAIPGGR